MAAELTGTPTAVTWAAGIDPAGQSITIPSDATAVYMFWACFYGSGEIGAGMASATLNSNAPAQTAELPEGTFTGATGVAVWYSPSTGSQTLDVAWDAVPVDGPTTIVVYVKGGDTSAWRDADCVGNITNASDEPITATLTTVSGDLVVKFDTRGGGTPPSLSASWTNGQTQTNGMGSRASYISASGTTQVCNSEDENFSNIAAVSIPAGSAAAYKPRAMLLGVG